ncbi:hypothetical protein NDY24_21135 [Xanthomonas hortorum pv. pelargonii]|nr:hypothetical protein NDY24_21135 [Xanthomonas hortorum pv. pelargonii]
MAIRLSPPDWKKSLSRWIGRASGSCQISASCRSSASWSAAPSSGALARSGVSAAVEGAADGIAGAVSVPRPRRSALAQLQGGKARAEAGAHLVCDRVEVEPADTLGAGNDQVLAQRRGRLLRPCQFDAEAGLLQGAAPHRQVEHRLVVHNARVLIADQALR